MYTINKFINDTLYLTNSLVIKLSDIAEAINKGIYIQTGLKPSEDKREWKAFTSIRSIFINRT